MSHQSKIGQGVRTGRRLIRRLSGFWTQSVHAALEARFAGLALAPAGGPAWIFVPSPSSQSTASMSMGAKTPRDQANELRKKADEVEADKDRPAGSAAEMARMLRRQANRLLPMDDWDNEGI